MKIKHEHIESVLLALAAEKGQAWVANAITEEYLRRRRYIIVICIGFAGTKTYSRRERIYPFRLSRFRQHPPVGLTQ